ncbi:MAG: UPF0280 family protein [Theionarchaea archaeon]|nr:UPF0280 family protein [Theionarchaea archaeon]
MELHQYSVNQGETRLLVKSDVEGVDGPVSDAVSEARIQLLSHIDLVPEFRWSMEPIEPPGMDLPDFIRSMYAAGQVSGVGPFASVAGALAGVAAQTAVEAGSSNVIVENGGDLCLYGEGPFTVGIFAGTSPFSQALGFRVIPGHSFTGLCTSSGTVGDSVSFGEADAVVAYVPDSPAVADALATSICNEVIGNSGVELGIEKARGIGVGGVAIIFGEKFGAWGKLPDLVDVARGENDFTLDARVHSRA